MTPTALALALVLAAPAPKEAPKKESPLVGQWVLESITFGGMNLNAQVIGKEKLTITFTKDGKTESTGFADQAGKTGSYTHDPKKDPAELDLVDPGQMGAPGRTSKAIYKIEGGTLTICTANDGDRPTAFDSPGGSTRIIMVLKRIAPKE